MPDDFHTFSKDIAKDFLQTVIVVDDRAFFPSDRKPEPVAKLTRPGFDNYEESSFDDDLQGEDETEANEQKHEELNAKELIDEFALNSIVCSVIRPLDEDEANLPTKIRNLAKSCDLIVFDWHIGKDRDGKLIQSLIREISSESIGKSKRNRLIAIYTGNGDLREVYNNIKKELLHANIVVTEDSKNFTLSAESIRIVIFAKPDSLTGRILKKREVPVKELPERLISEFTNMTSGLVSNVALRSLSIIRSHTHNLLSRFTPEIDPSFLSHKIMLPDPNDANTLLEMLIGAELTNLIEENEVGKTSDVVERSGEKFDVIQAWLNEHSNIDDNFGAGEQKPDQADILKLFREGLDKFIGQGKQDEDQDLKKESQAFLGKFNLKSEEKNSPQKVLTSKLINKTDIDIIEKADKIDCKFAELTSLKKYEQKVLHKLSLGTLLKCEKSQELKVCSESTEGTPECKEIIDISYWVCIQPLCDCVRLNRETFFPLLPLIDYNPKSQKKFDLVLPNGDEFIKVKTVLTPNSLRMVAFKPNEEQEAVIATQEKDKYVFYSTDNEKYIWVGELKFPHAQRIVNNFASQLSRVGLDESEWLRRWGK